MTYQDGDYSKIKVEDILVCLSNKGGKVEPVEWVVTRIDFLDMYGIRQDINVESEILGTSIIEWRKAK